MERAIKTVQGQYRTPLCQLVDKLGTRVKDNYEMIQWLAYWVSMTLNRYKVHPTGKTSFEMATGHSCRRPITTFGEKVLWKKNTKPRRDKGDSEFSTGIYLGVTGRTVESLIGTPDGLVKAYTVRRLPVEERWAMDDVEELLCPLPHSLYGPQEDPVDIGNYLEAEGPAPDRIDAEHNVTTEEVTSRLDEEADQDMPYSPTSPAQSRNRSWLRDDGVATSPSTIREDMEYNDEHTMDPHTASGHMDADTPSPLRRVPHPRRHRMDSDDEEEDAKKFKVTDGRVMHQEMFNNLIGKNEMLSMEVIKKLKTSVDVTEAYSPERVIKWCKKYRLLPGDAFDLLTGWNFDNLEHRNRAAKRIVETKPKLLICSPPCTLFSILQNLNIAVHGPEWERQFQLDREKAIRHLDFCRKLCQLQMKEGRYFLFEHPLSATSWSTAQLNALRKDPRVQETRADMCAHGMTAVKDGVRGLALKPTRFLSNSKIILDEVGLRCSGYHPHVHLHEGRAKAAAEYSDGLCQAICRGLAKQLTDVILSAVHSRAMDKRSLASMIAEAKRQWPEHWREDFHESDGADRVGKGDEGVEMLRKELYKLMQNNGKYWAVDDVSGADLVPSLVQDARQLEMDYFRRMGVYRKIKRPPGIKTIKTRWLDVNKGDKSNPDCRSRLVGKEFNDGIDPSLYAGTPPLEALRMVISRAATGGARGQHKKVMVNDVKRAYFHAKATRDIYIEIPSKDRKPGEGDVVGKLELCLYGTCDAALNWQRTVKAHLESVGFTASAAFPNVYHHAERDLCT